MRYTKKQKTDKILKEVSDILHEDGGSSVTAGSTDAERVLAILMNNQRISKSALNTLLTTKNEDGIFLKKYFNRFIKEGDPLTVYFGAISQIRKAGLPSNAKQTGTGQYPTTIQWRNYGGISSATSKSDVVTPSKTFSVKNASTQVRVLDASFQQVNALVRYALDKVGVSDEIQKTIKSSLNSVQKLYNSESAQIRRLHDKYGDRLGLASMRKVATPKLQKLIDAFDENTKQINTKINKVFKDASETKNFRATFIYESLSGKTMFGNKSVGKADSILTWTSDFSTIKDHDIASVTRKILGNFVMPKVATKTTGERVTKTFQMYLKATKEGVNEGMREFNSLVEQEEKLLAKMNGGLMTEGVFSNLWAVIKEKATNAIEKILKIMDDFISKAIEMVNNSWDAILDFFGLQLYVEPNYSIDADIMYGSL